MILASNCNNLDQTEILDLGIALAAEYWSCVFYHPPNSQPNSMKIEELVFMKTEELISRYRAGQRDFRNLNLIAANLRNVNLKGANLSGANLTKANLTRTNLSYANLSDTVITGANLTEASLVKANLTNANLSDVDLKQADLRGVIGRDLMQ